MWDFLKRKKTISGYLSFEKNQKVRENLKKHVSKTGKKTIMCK